MIKEALCWKVTGEKRITCNLCMRKCEIDNGHVGWCQTRVNNGGVLYTITYGQVASLSISPIEKKPMYHFFPGSLWLSLGGLGCNFSCHGCQSWELSHCNVKEKLATTTYLSPEMAVKKAVQNGCKGIAFTYNEPMMWFEYTLDVFKLAKEQGLSTCYVTNGFMSSVALEMLCKNLDGFCIDVKGGFTDTYTRLTDISDVNVVFGNTSNAKRKYATHVEVVTNIVSGYNSNEKEVKEIAAWIFAELGKDTPWHLTRFFPYGELKEVVPTPLALLESMRQMGMREGLLYVYIGNVPGHSGTHTYCQKCKKAVIKRLEFDEIENYMSEGRCPYCQSLIFGRFPL